MFWDLLSSQIPFWCPAGCPVWGTGGAVGVAEGDSGALSLSVPAMDNLQERALHVRKVLLNLPKTTLIVMRYLFAFLNQ